VRSETRHSLKEDRFRVSTIEAAESAAHWTAEHKSKLVVGGVVAAVLLLGGFGGWSYMNSQDAKASLELGQATRTMEASVRPANVPPQPDVPSFSSGQERATAVKKQLQAIIDKYPRTHSADVATYLMGTVSTELGDNASAERYLNQASSKGDAGLSSLAKLALASVYHKDGKDPQAVALYNELIAKPTNTVGKAAAQFGLAELYLDKQQPADAKRIYEQIQKENTGDEPAQLASQKLAELK
jgi:predicted negative regulator of RcsB-dependent stress response